MSPNKHPIFQNANAFPPPLTILCAFFQEKGTLITERAFMLSFFIDECEKQDNEVITVSSEYVYRRTGALFSEKEMDLIIQKIKNLHLIRIRKTNNAYKVWLDIQAIAARYYCYGSEDQK